MPAYPDRPSDDNPGVPHPLDPQPTPVAEHILDALRHVSVREPRHGPEYYNVNARTTRALAGIKPRVWDIRARLDRTGAKNTQGYVNGEHLKERGGRETDLEDDLATIKRRAFYMRCVQLPRFLQFKALQYIGELHRLLDETTWWKPQTYFNHREHRLRETTYLSEDTWSAQSQVRFLVKTLEGWYRAAGGIRSTPGQWVSGTKPGSVERARTSTEKLTPALLPFTPEIRRDSAPSATNEEPWTRFQARVDRDLARGQPEGASTK